MIKLDEYDKRLLFELDNNSRQTYLQLAKKIKISKDTIKYRMNNYKTNGLIDGFYALIDASKLGFYSIRVYFNISYASKTKEEEIIKFLKTEKRIFYLSKIEGKYSIGLGFFSKNIIEFQDFWKELKAKYPNKIRDEKFGIFTRLYQFNRNYLLKKKRVQSTKRSLGEPDIQKVDKVNYNILKILSQNAREQIIKICKKVNLTPKAVIRRIKNLEEKEIIIGYKAKINLEKIEHSMYKVDLITNGSTQIEKVKNYVFQLPNIINSEEVFGGTDFEFDVECKNYLEFEKIILKIKKEIGKDIESIKYYKTIKILKTLYLPEK